MVRKGQPAVWFEPSPLVDLCELHPEESIKLEALAEVTYFFFSA